MKKIIAKPINTKTKIFWCKKCKRSTNVIYKDDKGNSYCDTCLSKGLN